LSAFARKALGLSAKQSGLVLGPLEKDADGAPVPAAGIHWSISHKSTYVGGVVAPRPVGLDIERITACSAGLMKKVADAAEWDLSSDPSPKLFFRYWTAKEAVLKATGRGLRDLSRCRITAVIDDHHLRLAYSGKTWTVAHHYFDDHLASLTDPPGPVCWTVSEDAADLSPSTEQQAEGVGKIS